MCNKQQIESEGVWFGTSYNKEKFDKHIKDNNERIIFSAPFGTGKSTFLEKYFSKNEEYNVVSISPVHYSIPDNKDVFDLLKYDILYELLDGGVEVSDVKPLKFSENIFINKEVIFHNIIKNIPEVGKTLDGVFKSLNTVYNALEDSNRSEYAEMVGAVNLLEKSNYILGLDEITKICNALIQRSSENKESVLIIDDLDRIDPEHIFRLLNVFCASIDKKYDGSKFDFDHVIFVCDIENIKKIYEHRYGENVDFGGYIDKFCSKDIFDFNLEKEILYSFEDQFIDICNRNNSISTFVSDLSSILFFMLKYRLVSFRDMHYISDISKKLTGIRSSSNSYNTLIPNLRKHGISSRLGYKIKSEHERIEIKLVPDTYEYPLFVFLLYVVNINRGIRTKFLNDTYVNISSSCHYRIDVSVGNYSITRIKCIPETLNESIAIYPFKILKEIFENQDLELFYKNL